MYQIAGGKEESVTAATFLPRWWEVGDEEPEATSREALAAKFARLFGEMGGVNANGG